MTLTEFKKNIHLVPWSQEEKQKFISLLESQGAYVADYFTEQTFLLGSDLVSDQLIQVLGILGGLDSEVKNNNFFKTRDLLSGMEDNALFDFGELFLPFVLDVVKAVGSNKANIDRGILTELLKFELRHLDKVPTSAIDDFLSAPFLLAVTREKDFESLQNYIIGHGGIKDAWLKNAYFSLQSNKTPFGGNLMQIDGKNLPPTLQNWFMHFNSAVERPMSKRTSFDIIQFIKASPNSSRLTSEMQTLLIELLKFYMWMNELAAKQNVGTRQQVVFKDKFYLPDFNAAPRPVSAKPTLPKPPMLKPASLLNKKTETVFAKPAEVKSPLSPNDEQKPRMSQTEEDPYKTGLKLSAHGFAAMNVGDIKSGMEKKLREEEERAKLQEQKINQKLDELKKKIGN